MAKYNNQNHIKKFLFVPKADSFKVIDQIYIIY